MSAEIAAASDQLPSSFGKLLRSFRIRALLSQEQLAQRSGLGVRTIRDLEGGRVSYPHGKSIRLLTIALELVGEERQVFELASRAVELPPLRHDPPSGHRSRSLPTRTVESGSAVGFDQSVADSRPAPAPGGGLTALRSPGRPSAVEWLMPAQLPMDTAVFAGRSRELAQLDSLLDQVDGGPAVVVAAIWGGPGVGKTTLAIHWAHRIGDHFPDGHIYVDLHGFDSRGPAAPSQLICSVLGVLGVPGEQIPVDLHAQACLYRSLLHRRRVLVLLDNARNVEQVRPLLPATPGCLVVVTSREQLTSLIAVEGAIPLNLGLLTKTEARELLARRLGSVRVLAESAKVDEIIDQCARLPLAMAILASRAAASPNFPLSVHAEELSDQRAALDALDGAGSEVRGSFALSYQELSADAARVFELFGRSPAVDLTVASSAPLLDLPEAQVRAALGELSRAHLAVERRPGLFGTHRLLRAYAAEVAGL